MQVVIAWTEEQQHPDDPSAPLWDGISRRPTFHAVQVPKAVMWLIQGEAADLRAAERYVAANVPTGKVFTFPASERDPLGKARSQVLALTARAEKDKMRSDSNAGER